MFLVLHYEFNLERVLIIDWFYPLSFVLSCSLLFTACITLKLCATFHNVLVSLLSTWHHKVHLFYAVVYLICFSCFPWVWLCNYWPGQSWNTAPFLHGTTGMVMFCRVSKLKSCFQKWIMSFGEYDLRQVAASAISPWLRPNVIAMLEFPH